ncbi:MAG TPA: nitroreductase family protein [Stellaceae bacterium]|jgi:nitroreductase|nr:nitroreductase family protein [Stellaceae bacterium]
MDDIGLFEAIHSARSIRKLSPDPVPDALITRVLEAATQAPSAGNAQNWAFVVVRDPELRRKIGTVYRKGSDIAARVYAARGRPEHLSETQYQRFMASGGWLWDHLADAPVLLVVCVRPRPQPAREALPPEVDYNAEMAYADRIRGASIYPAVQNILLACRALGLGTVLTTNHLRCEDELKTLLGIPDEVQTFALMPIGWPLQNFGPLTRKPVRDVAFADRWGEAWPI